MEIIYRVAISCRAVNREHFYFIVFITAQFTGSFRLSPQIQHYLMIHLIELKDRSLPKSVDRRALFRYLLLQLGQFFSGKIRNRAVIMRGGRGELQITGFYAAAIPF